MKPEKCFLLLLGAGCCLHSMGQEPPAARDAAKRQQLEAMRLRGSPLPGAMDARIEKILKDQPAPRPGSRLRSLRTGDFIVEGPGHHLWALKVEGLDFAEWDGKTWQARPVPEAVASINLINADFLTDNHGQAWVLPFELDRTAVFDFASGQWHIFETLRQAVEQKLVPGDTLTKAYNSVNLGPASHMNGTKAFTHFDGNVHVLQKGQWHHTTLAEIGIKSRARMLTPFFSREGFFSIPYGDELFACQDGGTWRKIPNEEPESVPLRRVDPQPPPGGWGVSGTDIKSFCWDRTGAAWLATSTSGFLKWRDGIWKQLRDANEIMTLRPDASFTEVLLDSAGNGFLRYYGYDLVVHYEFVAAKPGGEVPAALWEPVSGGNGLIRLSGLTDGFQRWRLGAGKWSALGREPVIPFTGLLPGTYEVGLECFNAELSVLGPPSKVSFEIGGLTPTQVKEQIKLLRSPELSARENAAGVLRSQGAPALPALRVARAEYPEDESFQWWLQAVIQQIERSSEANR